MKRLACLLAILCGGSFAHAGQKLTYEVTVASSWAQGALGSARASADSNQMVMIQNGATWSAFYARDATGKTASCTTTSPDLIALARSANSDAFVYFTWDTTGACTGAVITNASYMAPKTP